MMRKFVLGLLVGAAVAAGVFLARPWRAPEPPLPPVPTYIESVREAVKLSTLEVEMHQIFAYEPDPPLTNSLGAAVKEWLKALFAKQRGAAMVFATARYLIDLSRLDEASFAVRGRTAYVKLPDLSVAVELKPEETIVLHSSLKAGGETALLAKAKLHFEAMARSDANLRARARASAERAVTGVLRQIGFTAVVFGVAPSPIAPPS